MFATKSSVLRCLFFDWCPILASFKENINCRCKHYQKNQVIRNFFSPEHGLQVFLFGFICCSPDNLHEWGRAACVQPERRDESDQHFYQLQIFSHLDFVSWTVKEQCSTWNNKSEGDKNRILKSVEDISVLLLLLLLLLLQTVSKRPVLFSESLLWTVRNCNGREEATPPSFIITLFFLFHLTQLHFSLGQLIKRYIWGSSVIVFYIFCIHVLLRSKRNKNFKNSPYCLLFWFCIHCLYMFFLIFSAEKTVTCHTTHWSDAIIDMYPFVSSLLTGFCRAFWVKSFAHWILW